MKLKPFLYYSVCSMLMLTGCSDKASLSHSNSQPNQPSDTGSGSSNILDTDTTPIANLNPNNVYLATSLIIAKNQLIELSDASQYITIDSYLTWEKEQKILPNEGSLPHSVADTQKISTLPNPESKKGIVIDAWGESSKKKAQFKLSKETTVSVLDLKDASLNVFEKGTLSTLAFRMENATLSISAGGSLKTHAMYVDANSTITNGDNISYLPESTDQFGISINDLKDQRHRRFPWATEGEFMIAGKVDHLNVTQGMKLYTQGSRARVQVLKHKGGTVDLTSSAPFNVDSYLVNSPSTLNVIWDTPTKTPLMTTDYTEIDSDVSVSLSQISSDVKTGDHVTLIKTTEGKLNQFEKALKTFGATFDLKTDAGSKQLTLTLTDRGGNPTGLSATALALANQSLNTATKLGQRLTVMDTNVAKTTLNHIASGNYLSPITNAPLSFDVMRLSNYESHSDGPINSAQHTAVHIQNAAGIKIGNHALIGISATNASAPFEKRSTVWGIHSQYDHFAADGFATEDGHLYGARIGVNYGDVQNASVSVDLTAQINARSGACDSAIGYVYSKNIQETRIISNLALKKRLETLEFCGRLFSEIHAVRDSHSMRINNETMEMSAESLPLSYGVQLQTSVDFKCGNFTGAYAICHENKAFVQKINLMFNVNL